MPFKSQQQRKLFYAAANKKGGVAGLSQEAAKKFIADSGPSKSAELPKFAKLRKLLKVK